MNPKKWGGEAPYAATSSSPPKNGVGHSSGGSGLGNNPKADQLIRDVAGLSIDTPQDDGWTVFSKNNKNGGETSSPKQWGTRIVEEVLRETVCDHEIVWPPMVVVRYHVKDDNEKVDKDDNEKWISTSRGNRKLPDLNAYMARRPFGPLGLFHYFSGYNAVQAWNSIGHRGHRGMSLLIFENSAIGYVEAAWLHKQFADQGKGRNATRHQFYGYMANKEDIDIFSQHCQTQGEMKVKFEMRSYHEMVVIPMKQMDEHKQRLVWLNNKVVRGIKDVKALLELYGNRLEKLRETMGKFSIMRQRNEVRSELAEILDEELRESVCDREIVWPPMVVVRGTLLDKNDNGKWIGMGNQELRDYLYNAVNAQHSNGPRVTLDYFSGYNAVEIRDSSGHMGISLLRFEDSAIGYVEAVRLHKHFADQGTDRDAWDHCKVRFLPDGTRHQLYGYMANKEDIDIFTQDRPGMMKLKFEMRSHQEMVVIPMKQMDEDNQLLVWLNNKISKSLLQLFGEWEEKLRETLEENRMLREHNNKEEEDLLEEAMLEEWLAQHKKLTEEWMAQHKKLMLEWLASIQPTYL